MVKSIRDNKISLSFKIGDFGEAEEMVNKNSMIYKYNLGTTEFRAPEGDLSLIFRFIFSYHHM